MPGTEMAPEALWPLVALALGLIMGSFANVCIYRIPSGESVVHPPSRCPACGTGIRPWDNVPVVSFLLLRGRCRHCQRPISWRYPLVEGTNGALYLLIARAWGPTATAGFLMVLVTALLVLSLIDLDHQILPNVVTLPGVVLGIGASLSGISGVDFRSSMGGAVGGFVAFWGVARVYQHLRRVEGLGQGDWKMAAMLGACLGWQHMLLTVLVASITGTLVGLALMGFRGRSAQQPLPFGTFLGFSGVLVIFVGTPVLQWYAGLLHG
jgi:leader peptidase (prepilin peptidase)/N-methyltransferase